MYFPKWNYLIRSVIVLLTVICIQLNASYEWREHNYDVLHYKIEVQFEHDKGKVIGQTTITLIPKKNNFKSFSLDAHQFDNVNVKMLNGSDLESIVGDTTITIVLPKEYKRSEKINVSVNYTCLPEKGLYFFSPDEAYPNRPKQIWSQGEDMDNHHWFPCYDYPNDHATFEVIATVDEGQTAISNGKLISTEKVRDKIKFHYNFDKPTVSYLISLIVGEYKKYEQIFNNIPVEYYVYPHHSEADALRSFGRTPAMMQFFSDYIGYDYPYSKYAQTIIFDFMYGCMENISATTQTDRTMHTEQAHLDHSSDGLVAHELAHQWWGDLITCREWTDFWLNEGFATYFTNLFTEYYLGFDEFSYKMYTTERKVVARENNKPQCLKEIKSVYIKGASVLYMLKYYIGEASFRAAINLYAKRFAFQNAETHDFRKAVEDASGINLYEFFDQWVFNPGIPDIIVSTQYDEENNKLRVLVKQEQDSAATKQFFNLKLFIGIEVENDYTEHQIHMTEREQEFTIDIENKPQMVIFDAGKVILKNLSVEKPVEEWMYQARNAYHVVDQIHAMEMLVKTSDSLNAFPIIEFLIDRFAKETFWGARLEAIKALNNIISISESERNKIYDSLKFLFASENKSSIRVEMIKAMAKGSSTDNINDFENYFHKDPSFDVRVAALNSAIELNPKKALDYINKALKINSWDEKIRTAALKKLEVLEDKKAFEIAQAYSRYGIDQKLRSTAIVYLCKLADKKFEPAVEALIDVVKERGESNRYKPVSRAINKLGSLKVYEIKPMLEEIDSNHGNRYLKRAAKLALKKLNEDIK